ncbi:MAG: SBBP repeat-containing protein [Thermodesulfobacteriota bacterium]
MAGGRRFPRSPLIFWSLLATLIGGMISFTPTPAPAGAGQAPERLKRPGPGEPGSRLPLYFVENRGQVEGRIKYYAQGQGRAVYFTPAGLQFSLLKAANPVGATGRGPRKGKAQREARLARIPAAHTLPLHFNLTPVGMSPGVKISGVGLQAGQVNYLRGADPKKWRTGIPTYGAVAYLDAYPGIDLKFYGKGRHLEYDVMVKPGADPGRVKFQYQGIKGLEVTQAGDLIAHLPDGGSLAQKKPFIYQVINGVRVPRQGGFKLAPGKDSPSYSFAVTSYDKTLPLIIDPEVLYSTYLGGSAYDVGNAIAVDSSGNAYITGCTFSNDFPTLGAYDSYFSGTAEVFVTKLNPAGNALVYSTYLGGEGSEEGYGIAVDEEGNAYVTGYTDSSSFPTMNPYQSSRKGTTDAFITKLNAAGNGLVYSTYLGDNYEDAAYAIAVDRNGFACVTGETFNIYSLYNAFIARFDPVGGLIYRTIFTGSNDDSSYGVGVDKNGNAYVTGETTSPDFITTAGALQGTFAGAGDAFVAKLNAIGAVVYSTFLGGANEDAGYGIAVDNNGNACVTGTTYSADFPLKNPAQAARKGVSDAFAAKLDEVGSTLSYSTYLGENYDDEGYGIALDRFGAAYITGWSSSPVAGSPGIYTANAYVAKLFPAGSKIGFFYLLGGSDDDWGNGIAVDTRGNVYVTGETWSKDFPTKNPFQSSLKGDADGFVAKIKATLSMIAPIIAPLLME